MISYETYCKIRDCHERERLTIAQTARALGLHAKTVAKWVKRSQFRARQSAPRISRLDPFKAQIVRLLETHPYSAQQIYQRLREEGFEGGFTILKDYVRKVTPSASGSLPQALLCPRGVRPTRLGSMPSSA